MKTNSVKESVIESYGKLAKSRSGNVFSKLFACCSPVDLAAQVGEKIGYSREEIQSAPDDSNLGVGCGNPSALAKLKQGQTVIDLGSGAGFDAFLVSPIVGQEGKVIGVDLSDDMLALARKNVQKGNCQNVDFVKGDIEKLPLENEIADHIISNCVINRPPNKKQILTEAYITLKPGGKLKI